ncbi:MAG: tRNA (adenine-N(6)-)-methyltransferase [Flavobacteriales bacterium]|mgnify:CR=1 FL=1|nr:tRNA (adenine-N(6)-)-methyltransferase [Flavobacteriales bacterium]|tara:strand:+ start:823 stop:1518 length:696 start_codon:yes stop_codon:yes gene_type:complete
MFRFKKFGIMQDKCAMKVGTDGTLLGAWVKAKSPEQILDIGTGTGLIAMMLAQRFVNAQIKAIEIDSNASQQTAENFQNTPWINRLFLEHISLQEFQHAPSFDLIVSNPPYFENNLKANNKKRTQARHTDTLSFETLIECSSKLLNKNGSLAIILPSESKDKVEAIAQKNHLHLNRLCWVKGTEKTAIKRALLQFSFQEKLLEENTLVVEKERHVYTEEYTEMCKEFYLKM